MSWDSTALLLISGPTAVGKTALALSLAEALGGEIVNIDSVQLYRGLDIGSAKPSIVDRSRVPHHLFDIFEPTEQGTVARYISAALTTIGELRARGKLPILVGGTGLYITALLQGLADLPPVDAELRASLEAQSTAELRAKLVDLDEASARGIAPNDRIRTVRALETVLLSGIKASDLRTAHGYRTQQLATLTIIPLIDRDELYRRINLRSQKMLEQGLIEEVETLVQRYGIDAPALDAIGYREVVQVLQGAGDRAALAETIALNTRRFAKRQLTFWRNEPAKRGWLVRPSGRDTAVEITGTSLARRAQVKPIAALPWSKERLAVEIELRLRQPLERSEVWLVAGAPKLAS